MARRLELHNRLEELLGSKNVYFQPPESVKMQYPCIVYQSDDIDVNYADDKVYKHKHEYSVTIISKNPEHNYQELMLYTFPLIRFDRRFVADNLYHDVFRLYF